MNAPRYFPGVARPQSTAMKLTPDYAKPETETEPSLHNLSLCGSRSFKVALKLLDRDAARLLYLTIVFALTVQVFVERQGHVLHK